MQDTEYCVSVLHCLAYPSLLGKHRIMELEEDHVVQILLKNLQRWRIQEVHK